jgi:hypothetical protein
MCGAWNRKGCSTAASTPGGIETVAQLTEGFSFAYLKELCLAAAMAWMNAGPQSSMDAIARIQAECLTAQMSSQPTEAEQPDGHLTPRQRGSAPVPCPASLARGAWPLSFDLMITYRTVILVWLSLVACSAPAQGILSNGSFETLVTDPQGNDTLPPWVLPRPGDWGGQFRAGPGVAVDGWNFINFRGLAYQDLSTTPGQQYRLSFWTSDLSTDAVHQWPSQLSVLWNGAPVATERVDWPEWRRRDHLLSATGPVTRLGLQVELGSDHILRFDDVTVVAVPEPGVAVLGGMGCLVLWLAGFRA